MTYDIDSYNITLLNDSNCPTQIYNWIKIVNTSIDVKLYINKSIMEDISNYSDLRNIFKINLPIMDNTVDGLLKEIICVYDTFDSIYNIFKIIQTNNTHSIYDGEIKVGIKEFNNLDTFYKINNNIITNELVINIYSSPPLYKKKQEKMLIQTGKAQLVYPIYTKKNVLIKNIDRAELFLYPLISPINDVTLKMNICHSVNCDVEDAINQTKFDAIINFIDDTKNPPKTSSDTTIQIKKMTDMFKKYLFSLSIENSGETVIKIKWTINGGNDYIFDLEGKGQGGIYGYIYIKIVSVRFRLNYSNSSFQTYINNDVIQNVACSNCSALGVNFNSIIMNKDSDWEYLIVETLPYLYNTNDIIEIYITSSNENVLKSFKKSAIASNTSSELRLQRFGDPRDYINESSLIKLNCINTGKTTLSFKIKCATNSIIDNSILNDITLYSVGLKVYTLNNNVLIPLEKLMINIASEEVKNVVIKPYCHGINNIFTDKLLDQTNFVIPLMNKKKIKNVELFKNLTNNFLNDIIFMKPETDLDIIDNYTPKELNINIHSKTRSTNEKNVSEGTLSNVNILNINNTNKQGIINIIGDKTGSCELIFLVNSLMKVSKYLSHSYTFVNDYQKFSQISSLKNKFMNNVWPGKNIASAKIFDISNGINEVDKTYKYVSNGGPDILSCETQKTYGWTEENFYNRINTYNTNEFMILNLEKFIKTNFNIVDTSGACSIFFGKYIDGEFDRDYWSKRNLNMDFYIKAVEIPQQKFKFRAKTDTWTPPPVAGFISQGFIYSQNIEAPKNKIINLYSEKDNLYIYCELTNELLDEIYKKDRLGKYILSNTSIKLLFEDENFYYHNAIFTINDKSFEITDWGDKISFLLILNNVLKENGGQNLNHDVSFNNTDISGEWIYDQTRINNASFYRDLQEKKNNLIRSDAVNILTLNTKFDNLEIILNVKSDEWKNKISIINIIETYLIDDIHAQIINLREEIKNIKKNEKINLINQYDKLFNSYTLLLNLYENNDDDNAWDKEKNKINIARINKWKYKPIIIDKIKQEFEKETKTINTLKTLYNNSLDKLDKITNDLIGSISNIDALIKQYDESLLLKEEQKIEPIIISNKQDFLWLDNKNVNNINEIDIRKFWIKSEERYKLQFMTVINISDNEERKFYYTTDETEIKDLGVYLKDPKRGIHNDAGLAISKQLAELKIQNKKLLRQNLNRYDALYNELSLSKNKLKMRELNENLIKQEKGGNGGLFYVEKINKEYINMWKEWDIKYYIRGIPIKNFNKIINFNTSGFGINKNLLIYCEGKNHLTFDNNIINTNEIFIKLIYFNNIYDANTIFKIINLKSYGIDNYILEIQPLVQTITPLINYELYENKIPYWKMHYIEERKEVIASDIINDWEYVDGKCQEIKLENVVDKEEDKKKIKIQNLPTDGTPLMWAHTNSLKKIEIDIPDISNVQFQCSAGYFIQLYSKISITEQRIYPTKDNYYRNEYFKTLPVASNISNTTFSIYTSGSSNTEMYYNNLPPEEFWHASKINPVLIDIVNVPSVILNPLRLIRSGSTHSVDITWKFEDENEQKKSSKYEIYKFDAYDEFPEWKFVHATQDRYSWRDPDIELYNTYFYKIKVNRLYGEEILYGKFSNSEEIFICGNKNFKDGRFNYSITNKKSFPSLRNCDGSFKKTTSIYYNTENKLTKKQIFAMLAKKTGGGILR